MKMNPSHKRLLFWSLSFCFVPLLPVLDSPANQKNDAAVAVITYQGKDIRTVDLSTVKKTETFTLGEPGEQNTIQISPKGIGVIEADCRDQICVKQGIHSHGPEPIVCLPHKLSIRFISSNTDNSLDAVTGR
ncbi:MAG: NusG domain II-containing protein [Clostridium sp.]